MRDLNDLYLFAAVVSHEGFSSAARALQIPKSQLSKRVAHLEAELGVRLLVRSTRTVRVTDVGQAFYDECKGVLASVAAAEALVGEHVSEPRGDRAGGVPSCTCAAGSCPRAAGVYRALSRDSRPGAHAESRGQPP